MGLTSILRGFAAMLFIVGAAMAAPLLVAFAQGGEGAGAYLFGLVLCLTAGAATLAASIGRAPPSDFRGALVIILVQRIAVGRRFQESDHLIGALRGPQVIQR